MIHSASNLIFASREIHSARLYAKSVLPVTEFVQRPRHRSKKYLCPRCDESKIMKMEKNRCCFRQFLLCISYFIACLPSYYYTCQYLRISLFVWNLYTTRDLCWLMWVSRGVPLGKLMPWQISNRSSLSSVTRMYDTIPSMSVLSKVDVKQLSAGSDRFLNASSQYAEAAADALVSVYGQYNWLLKAMISGLVMTSFTWFILYKDSSIPGVNPPSPFSPSKQR